MTSTFSEIQERLAAAPLRELIILAAAGIEGKTFNELAALRERFLDIAFRDEHGDFNDRLLSAVWSRAIDSSLMLMLEDRPETRAAYVQARNTSMEEILQFGFGSVGRAATEDQDELLNRLSFSLDRNEEVEEVRLLQAYLTAAAFGVGTSRRARSAALYLSKDREQE